MELQWSFVLLSIFVIIQIHGAFDLPPQFWTVFHSLQGPEGISIKSKIYHAYLRSNNMRESASNNDNYEECYERLLHIMANDLKCPRAANNMKPYLNIIEFSLNMTREEKFVKSWFENKCTHLEGRTANICELVLSRERPFVSYESFYKIMDDCRSEPFWQSRESNESLSLRSEFSRIHFMFPNSFFCTSSPPFQAVVHVTCMEKYKGLPLFLGE